MTVIDLGEITDEPAPEPPRRPVDLGWVPRALPCLLVAAAVVATCVSAAGPNRDVPRQLLVTAESSAMPALDGNLLYAATATGHLTRYDLRHGGRTDYRALTGLTAPPLATRVAAGTVFVTTLAEQSTHTVAFDARTGARRWDHAGRVGNVLADGRVLFDDGPAVDLATGRVLWGTKGSYLLGPDYAPQLPLRMVGIRTRTVHEGADQVLTATLELSVPETGEVLASRVAHTRRVTGGMYTSGEEWQVLTYPGYVLLEDRNDGLTGHDPVTLTELWRWNSAVGLIGGAPCGTLICVSGPGGAVVGPVTAIDPATGRPRWQVTAFGAIMADGSYRRQGGNALLLDPVTGRVRDQLAGWRVLDTDRRFPDRIPMVRALEGGGYWLGLLDGPTGRMRPLLGLAQYPERCDGNERYLACVDSGGRLRAWSYGVH